ncbi:tyrosine-type recombinase/integrase [Neptuniibacter sp. QD48_11]|uniref:tyrosine-type recombinase/integrase n=1 Tax=Neptuniibacter sp. QD48_11 TaxID=3398211 RepID=UPI0039F5254D
MSDSDYHKIVDGVAIYKQKTSRFWWVNITVEDQGKKQYIKKSSKETDKEKAIEKAFEIKLLLRLKQENNIPLHDNAPTFTHITKILTENYKKKKQRSTYRTYYLHWKRLGEHFGHKRVDSIDTKDLLEFLNEFKITSDTQLTTTKTALKRLYEYCKTERLIRQFDIPEFPRIDDKEDPIGREIFSESDLAHIFNDENFDRFEKNGRKELTRSIRKIFAAYLTFLWDTGLRAGTESQSLKWKSFTLPRKVKSFESEFTFEKQRGLNLKVNEGKVSTHDRRTIPVDKSARTSLDYLAQIQSVDGIQLVIKRDERYLFRVNQNKAINFIDVFNQYKDFLKESCGYEIEGNKTLYSFRHTYITRMLMKGKDVHLVAKATGTSTAMIDKYYSKLTAIMNRNALLED